METHAADNVPNDFLTRLQRCVSECTDEHILVTVLSDHYLVGIRDICEQHVERFAKFACEENCDIIMTCSGIIVREEFVQRTNRQDLGRPVLARIRKLSRVGGYPRASIQTLLRQICSFSLTHFMPNFTIEERTGGEKVMCNLARVSACDLASLDVDSIRYSQGYLTIETISHKRKREGELGGARKRRE